MTLRPQWARELEYLRLLRRTPHADGLGHGDASGMTTHPRRASWRRSPTGRAFSLGFLIGFLVTVPAVILALLSPLGERLQPFLTPGVALLRPLSSAMAGWNGGVNMLLASLANGLAGGALLAALALAVGRRRPTAQDSEVLGPDSAALRGKSPGLLPAAMWLVTALTAALPGLLLLQNAGSRLPKAAAIALLLAGVMAACLGVACALSFFRMSRGAGTAVGLLCVAAPIALDVHGTTFLGYAIFGGAAAVLSVLSTALTVRASRRHARLTE
jgi:hypothetical protein